MFRSAKLAGDDSDSEREEDDDGVGVVLPGGAVSICERDDRSLFMAGTTSTTSQLSTLSSLRMKDSYRGNCDGDKLGSVTTLIEDSSTSSKPTGIVLIEEVGDASSCAS